MAVNSVSDVYLAVAWSRCVSSAVDSGRVVARLPCSTFTFHTMPVYVLGLCQLPPPAWFPVLKLNNLGSHASKDRVIVSSLLVYGCFGVAQSRRVSSIKPSFPRLFTACTKLLFTVLVAPPCLVSSSQRRIWRQPCLRR